MKFWGQEVNEIEKGLWATHIRKPVYGTCVALNGLLLDKAIESKVKIKVTCPGGEEIIDPAEWKETALYYTKVFKKPNDPMPMYQKSINSLISE